MTSFAGIVALVVVLVPLAIVGAVFVWAARKDGAEDKALQARLGDRPEEGRRPQGWQGNRAQEFLTGGPLSRDGGRRSGHRSRSASPLERFVDERGSGDAAAPEDVAALSSFQ
jgi:hypothetical protein